jgi:Na+/H+ antiporter NhaD/arsenite permease-like protein
MVAWIQVGGLGLLGYLDMLAKWAYGGFGATIANVFLGLVSGLVDNIPVMFAVLSVVRAPKSTTKQLGFIYCSSCFVQGFYLGFWVKGFYRV